MKNIYPTLKCQEFTPECMPKDDLVRSYGNFTVVSHYSQMRCCKTHFCFRRAVEFASEYYRNKYNVPIFLTDGSLLGVYRHHATQVPWEKDADVMAVLGVVPHFSFANYIDILMSPNNDPNYNQTFKVVKNRRDSFHLFVNNSLCLDISLWVEASPLRGMRYLNYMNREWSNAINNVPYNVIFPPQHCPWYGSKLKDLCMADMKEYVWFKCFSGPFKPSRWRRVQPSSEAFKYAKNRSKGNSGYIYRVYPGGCVSFKVTKVGD